MTKKLAVVAIGGNSLIKDKTKITVQDQYLAAKETCYRIADRIERRAVVHIGFARILGTGGCLLRHEKNGRPGEPWTPVGSGGA